MDYRRTHAPWRATALACLLAGLLCLLLARTQAVQAAGQVTDCTGSGLLAAMSSGSGLITFDCGPDPVVIIITQTGGINIANGFFYTIDGGDRVTLSGANIHRIFDVRVGGALTLTNIILTDGRAFSGGNLPDLGGAILDEGMLLTLDHVTIRNSRSSTAGGPLRSSPARY